MDQAPAATVIFGWVLITILNALLYTIPGFAVALWVHAWNEY